MLKLIAGIVRCWIALKFISATCRDLNFTLQMVMVQYFGLQLQIIFSMRVLTPSRACTGNNLQISFKISIKIHFQVLPNLDAFHWIRHEPIGKLLKIKMLEYWMEPSSHVDSGNESTYTSWCVASHKLITSWIIIFLLKARKEVLILILFIGWLKLLN